MKANLNYLSATEYYQHKYRDKPINKDGTFLFAEEYDEYVDKYDKTNLLLDIVGYSFD